MCWLHMKFLLFLHVWVAIMSQIHFSHSLFICWADLAIIFNSQLTPLSRNPSALGFFGFFPIKAKSSHHHLA